MIRIAPLALLAVLGCQAQGPPPDPEAGRLTDPAAVEAGVRQAFEAFVAHSNAAEWDTVLAFYSDDSDFHWVEDGALAYPSKADLAAAVEGIYDAVEEMGLEVDDVRVLPLADDLAWLTASWKQSFTLASGDSFSYAGATTILCEREGDRWVFLAGHNSTAKPRGG